MDVGMYNNQQNGYGGAEYYQQGAAYQPPYEGYHEGYYETPGHYYEPVLHGQTHEHPPTPVISTDTGLCYTNLDYGELQPNYPIHTLPPHPEPFKHREDVPRHEEMVMHEHKLDNHYLETKYNMHFVDETTMQYNHAGSPLPCPEFEHYQPKDEFGGLRDGFPREECMSSHSHLQGHQAHASHATVPTYKWMQVKRNVPKPTGKLKYYFIGEKSYYVKSLVRLTDGCKNIYKNALVFVELFASNENFLQKFFLQFSEHRYYIQLILRSLFCL